MSSPSSDMVRVYLQEIGRYPMLTADQEIAYGRQVQQMMAIEQRKNELAQQLKPCKKLCKALGTRFIF
ncbi:sigma-70 factor domain-containing protein [Nostoc favosum]|uniref:RNA polymerase sigma-70 region 1.2 domain-containing protein n=1 Tax=Nostoc favosum CHAB5714 TaxID=2780399 RepID=A0ABS8ILK7_9NOSO|nr:sigma-70 factor domain-containing protein [Nostoc favosum]MCC5605013.1 hypothetical protein [Nostoc favosum CHAB5714]